MIFSLREYVDVFPEKKTWITSYSGIEHQIGFVSDVTGL